MSKSAQYDAMVSYFNSLLTEIDAPELQKVSEEQVTEKPFAEKVDNRHSLQTLLDSVVPTTETEVLTTTEVSVAEPVVEPIVETVAPIAETVTIPEVQTEVETVVEEQQETIAETITEVAEPIQQIEVVTEVQETVATVEETVTYTAVETQQEVVEETTTTEETTTATDVATQTEVEPEAAPAPWKNLDTGPEFSALFFKVAGITLAVPLKNLGGIFEPGKITTIFGKPNWFTGMTSVHNNKVGVVDTAKWLMPGKEVVEHEYRYVIALDNYPWCIQCDELIGTKNVSRNSVKWRESAGSRPWLSGILKEEMCALLHVDELVKMLDSGVDVKSLLEQ